MIEREVEQVWPCQWALTRFSQIAAHFSGEWGEESNNVLFQKCRLLSRAPVCVTLFLDILLHTTDLSQCSILCLRSAKLLWLPRVFVFLARLLQNRKLLFPWSSYFWLEANIPAEFPPMALRECESSTEVFWLQEKFHLCACLALIFRVEIKRKTYFWARLLQTSGANMYYPMELFSVALAV